MTIDEFERLVSLIPAGLTQSQKEEWLKAHGVEPGNWRQHEFVGGTPPKRIHQMQLAHETRARTAGVVWDLVDLRLVYERAAGLCGICGEPVDLESFTIDHKKPIHLGGSHTLDNLQVAHRQCNSAKGGRWP